MGLLDNHPELLEKFTVLAEGFAKTGYVAPMNVLWTYHFINENSVVADSIWENYVKGSNQIMFQKVQYTILYCALYSIRCTLHCAHYALCSTVERGKLRNNRLNENGQGSQKRKF